MNKPVKIECNCEHCRHHRGEIMPVRMYVCPVCGNKRCPKARLHAFRCTGSNAPDQIGVEE